MNMTLTGLGKVEVKQLPCTHCLDHDFPEGCECATLSGDFGEVILTSCRRVLTKDRQEQEPDLVWDFDLAPETEGR